MATFEAKKGMAEKETGQQPERKMFTEIQVMGLFAILGAIVGLLMMYSIPETAESGAPLAIGLLGTIGMICFEFGPLFEDLSSTQITEKTEKTKE